MVAFANSIVFQASGGFFKQIPGVNLAWHEITLKLPPACDYAALKESLLAAVERRARGVPRRHRAADERDPEDNVLQRGPAVKRSPQVQLRFSAASVEAVVRYPVQLQRAAEIDERVSRELMRVLSADRGSGRRSLAPAQ